MSHDYKKYGSCWDNTRVSDRKELLNEAKIKVSAKILNKRWAWLSSSDKAKIRRAIDDDMDQQNIIQTIFGKR